MGLAMYIYIYMLFYVYRFYIYMLFFCTFAMIVEFLTRCTENKMAIAYYTTLLNTLSFCTQQQQV